MRFLRYVSSMYRMLSGKRKRLSTVSISTSIGSVMSFASSSTSSAQPLYAPPALVTNYAEMMDDDDMAWGPPRRRR
ncbi:hypothetical protein BJV77DRAFT_561520 [Russula vinacea]|nr:hypothetical protein BJV77DRAFT_561520 [Russula vinacea]